VNPAVIKEDVAVFVFADDKGIAPFLVCACVCPLIIIWIRKVNLITWEKLAGIDR
jgi:hypothetical protein